MEKLTFNKKSTRAEALASADAGKIFFPTDSASIILGGKEYGGTEDARIGDLSIVTPLSGIRHQSVAGFVNELNFKMKGLMGDVANAPFTFSNSGGFTFTAPSAVSATFGQTVNVRYTVTRSDGATALITDLLDNLAVASNAGSRASVTKDSSSTFRVTISAVQLNDRFYVYDKRDPLLRTSVYDGIAVAGGPTSTPTVQVMSNVDSELGRVQIVAYVSDFSPRDINIYWKINGAITDDGIVTGTPQIQPDGKFNVISVMTRTAAQYETYDSVKVQVSHQGRTFEVDAK